MMKLNQVALIYAGLAVKVEAVLDVVFLRTAFAFEHQTGHKLRFQRRADIFLPGGVWQRPRSDVSLDQWNGSR